MIDVRTMGFAAAVWLIPLSLSGQLEEVQRYLEGMVVAGFADRPMFGSDQILWPQRIEESIRSIESADFLIAGQRAILYDNAASFLSLTEEEPNTTPLPQGS